MREIKFGGQLHLLYPDIILFRSVGEFIEYSKIKLIILYSPKARFCSAPKIDEIRPPHPPSPTSQKSILLLGEATRPYPRFCGFYFSFFVSFFRSGKTNKRRSTPRLHPRGQGSNYTRKAHEDFLYAGTLFIIHTKSGLPTTKIPTKLFLISLISFTYLFTDLGINTLKVLCVWIVQDFTFRSLVVANMESVCKIIMSSQFLGI